MVDSLSAPEKNSSKNSGPASPAKLKRTREFPTFAAAVGTTSSLRLPQDRNAARVEGCSGAIPAAFFISLNLFPTQPQAAESDSPKFGH